MSDPYRGGYEHICHKRASARILRELLREAGLRAVIVHRRKEHDCWVVLGAIHSRAEHEAYRKAIKGFKG